MPYNFTPHYPHSFFFLIPQHIFSPLTTTYIHLHITNLSTASLSYGFPTSSTSSYNFHTFILLIEKYVEFFLIPLFAFFSSMLVYPNNKWNEKVRRERDGKNIFIYCSEHKSYLLLHRWCKKLKLISVVIFRMCN